MAGATITREAGAPQEQVCGVWKWASGTRRSNEWPAVQRNSYMGMIIPSDYDFITRADFPGADG